MSAAGAKRVANGEIAAICACALLSRLDPETPAATILLDRALLIERRLPNQDQLMTGVRFTHLAFLLHDFALQVQTVVRRPSGERDWTEIDAAQRALRQAVDRCLEVLGDRCFAVWSGGGIAATPRPGGLVAEGAE